MNCAKKLKQISKRVDVDVDVDAYVCGYMSVCECFSIVFNECKVSDWHPLDWPDAAAPRQSHEP